MVTLVQRQYVIGVLNPNSGARSCLMHFHMDNMGERPGNAHASNILVCSASSVISPGSRGRREVRTDTTYAIRRPTAQRPNEVLWPSAPRCARCK